MEITFQSKIRLLSNKDFKQATRNFDQKYFIDYPWGLKNSVYGEKAYTTNVLDCTVCGINDGKKFLMLHISPDSNDGYNFASIENFITKHINLKKPNIKGFLIGSKMGFDVFERSERLFDRFKNFMQENKIPYSELRGGIGAKDVAYDVKTDELLIGTELIEKEKISSKAVSVEDFAKRAFQQISISEDDKISW